MAQERRGDDLSDRSEVGAGVDQLSLRLWASPIDVVSLKTPPLDQLRRIADGSESGFVAMVGVSPSPPRHVAAFTFTSKEGRGGPSGLAAGGDLRVDARFHPAFDGGLQAPITAMVGAVRSRPSEPGDEFALAGSMDYLLANGETVSDHEVTIKGGFGEELKKLMVRCSNLADQSWYMLVIYN
jgi:hypothetical protein